MKRNEIKGIIGSYFEEVSEPLNTSVLLNKLNPVILKRCEEIRRKKKDKSQARLFALCCIMVCLAGLFVMFPEIVDYSNEMVQFSALGLAIGFLVEVFIKIFDVLLANKSLKQEMKLRGRLL